MTHLAKWIGCLLLAGSTSACASAGLYDWATEKAPRSEVLGFVDRGGDGDALLILLDGEKTMPDGVYELPVAAASERQAPRTPLRLDRAREKDALQLRRESKHVARLDTTDASCECGWLLLDGFESVAGSLHRIKIPERRYYLSDEGQVEGPGASSRFTKVAVHEQPTFFAPYEVRGAAYLPPARRMPRRMAAGVAAAPLVVAVDIATLPLQWVAAAWLTGLIRVDDWRVSADF